MNGYGFRRRCSWCAVQLRNWQLNLCRKCKRAVNSDGGPWTLQKSRWEEEPDTIKVEI